MADRYQQITMTLSDGRRLTAIVPEFYKEGDPPLRLRSIEVNPAQDMPPDCHWAPLAEGEILCGTEESE
jgi:hypothetical protein